ncbi:magnesium chelatase subunit H [Rhodocyclus tenuis]|uniref:magnesium chelatase n=1 Tax=Rhodocyclus gracilis TaxID=2929842 RepID=A0ABX0WKT1_9RHOO|nr:magnesium chelatase subunit H [Rhodocyclus gracilis]NJA90219.1 magnesium chelatase subunit H [Rhodocyclus gracilis]
MLKRTSAAKSPTPGAPTPIRVVIVTLDNHLASAAVRAQANLARELPGLSLTLHAAADFVEDEAARARAHADIAQADILVATMLFLEEHIQAVLPALTARAPYCDAVVGCMSAGEIVRLTRLDRFKMDGSSGGTLALLKRLRGKHDDKDEKKDKPGAAGAQQMKMLRRIPQFLRFIPGAAQDVRAYFLTLQYWLAASDDNLTNMVRLLVDRYADGERRGLRGTLKVAPPTEYPEVGLYHPRLSGRIGERLDALPRPASPRGTVGLLVMRSYVLAGNASHYDGVIDALEAQGLAVVPAFASGLDARPAVEQFFLKDGQSIVDAVVSLTGFSLVGGPAYNDASAAEEILARLDVPYIAATPVEFQTLQQWSGSDRGLMPVESTMMVAIPELDGATGSIVFGGRAATGTGPCPGCSRACTFECGDGERDMSSCGERAVMLAARVARQVALRRTPPAERKIAIVIFNFPPNAGNLGAAAFLSVFASLHNTLTAMKAAGYRVEDVPDSVDALRESIVVGNAARYGADANVHLRIPADDHVRREKYLAEIEAQWGPAPGRQQSDGAGLFVLGRQFGNVFVGIQPSFGYEGDPMRLLFEKGFAPTHAFSAFYRFLREDFGAHAALHFGTHGALEFMPGKQNALSSGCWPDRMIGDLPNLYLYAANNPSEGAIAKRRSAATLLSYLTPPIAQAGLYRGLADLKSSLERYRALSPEELPQAEDLITLIQVQAAAVDLVPADPLWTLPAADSDPASAANELATLVATLARLNDAVVELEQTLIPHGLHVVGVAPSIPERIDFLMALAEAAHGVHLPIEAITTLVEGDTPEGAAAAMAATTGKPVDAATLAALHELARTNRLLAEDHEIPALLRALDGRFVRPAPGGDLVHTPAILPTGRNLHGFDPFRIPSAFALMDGARQAARLIDRHLADGNPIPESIALVLWGTDNLKSEGGPIAQALALMGAEPRFDSYGRLAGAQLRPLDTLGRPRIDVVMTLSGIFRDLLPLQTRLLAEAAFLAATADEPPELNFVRKHTLAYQAEHGCDIETAALRVFSNADGAYGSNVNHLIANGRWEDEDELAETYSRRKCFAHGRTGKPVQQAALLQSALADVALTYQNLESVELGVTTQDVYFDTLGGISRAVRRARGESAPVYIGDQTRGDGVVRTLGEQVALETRTRMLNPKWYEGMLKHGYEGVRQIEEHVTNTMGWSATTGQVAPWVYQQITQTYMLDPEMRERLAQLNPTASAKLAHRLLEAQARQYWSPDEDVLDALRRAGEELEDRIEGVDMGIAA